MIGGTVLTDPQHQKYESFLSQISKNFINAGHRFCIRPWKWQDLSSYGVKKHIWNQCVRAKNIVELLYQIQHTYVVKGYNPSHEAYLFNHFMIRQFVNRYIWYESFIDRFQMRYE